MAAAFTVKMRVCRMIFAGSQAINKGASAAAQPLDQSARHEQIKDPIDRHAIDRPNIFQGMVYFGGRKWKVTTADDLQNTKAVSGCPEVTGL
jgi:hypothetical protein